MTGGIFRRNLLVVLVAAPIALIGCRAGAGEIADQAAMAESLLSAGQPSDAEDAFSKAFAALWTASPLAFRVALFADSIESFGKYQPRADQPFHHGDSLLVYMEPINYGFTADGDLFKVALSANVEIRSPGGLVFGKSSDFGRLEWSGRSKMHEVHASISFPLPDLKPGDYDLLVTLHDQGSPKSATLTLPFAVAE